MGATLASTVIDITVSLIPAELSSTGLGELCVLAPEGAAAISGGFTSYSSPEDVATALAATELTAQAAADLTAALSQSGSPSRVWVATYDDATEDPSDAADVIDAAGVGVGVLVPISRVTADLAALGTWLASGQRRWSYRVVAQSAESSLITGTPSAGLDALKVPGLRLIYAADAKSEAAALGGRIAGYNFARDGQMGSRASVSAGTPGTLTNAEVTFATANNVDLLLPLDVNSSTTAFVGRHDYDGSSFSVVATLQYTVRRVREAVTSLQARYAALAKPIPLSGAGEAVVRATLAGVLSELAAVGHFTPGTSGTGTDAIEMPDGFDIRMSRSGGDLVAAVRVIIAGEPRFLRFNIIAEEAS